MKTSSVRRCWLGAAVAVAVFTFTPPAPAQTNRWTAGASGSWQTPGTWSLGVRPTNTHLVYITNAVTKTVTIDAGTAGGYPASLTISNLTLAGPAGTVNTLFIYNSGTTVPLTVSNDFTINSGGVLRINNGALTVQGCAGGFFSDDGIATLESGVMTISNCSTVIGNVGVGVLTNYLGLMDLRDVTVGNNAGSEGRWVIAGGTNRLSSTLQLGSNAGAAGAVVVSGGQLIVTNDWTSVGDSGVGQMTVSNGLALLKGTYVGHNAGSQGNLTVAGGGEIRFWEVSSLPATPTARAAWWSAAASSS